MYLQFITVYTVKFADIPTYTWLPTAFSLRNSGMSWDDFRDNT